MEATASDSSHLDPHLILENLRRAVDECEALEAIYGCHEVEAEVVDSSFRLVSRAELQTARDVLLAIDDDAAAAANDEYVSIPNFPPALEVEICLGRAATLRCRLPSGYPDIPAGIVVSSAPGLRRATRDELTAKLKERAAELQGQEMVLELVEYLKEMLPQYHEEEETLKSNQQSLANSNGFISNNGTGSLDGGTTSDATDRAQKLVGRRWIWVHHITNAGRCKAIVQEARELGLAGCLKSGYPGIVVVEGPADQCDEFVTFIKGNKSRPGGFGRNWGHHVRGHIDFDCASDESNQSHNRFGTEAFEDIGEDMANLSSRCTTFGLEDEFKEYVMQHK